MIKKKKKHPGRNIFLTLFILLFLASGSYALYHFGLIPQEAFDDDKVYIFPDMPIKNRI